MPLQKRINILRKAKSDCKHMIKHFKNDCDRSFVIIQILEIFSGTRYKNNKVFPIERMKRLKREDYWVKRLRTIYPCGLNERARKHNSEVPVGKLFFLYLEPSNDLPDLETTMIIWKMTLSQTFLQTVITSDCTLLLCHVRVSEWIYI